MIDKRLLMVKYIASWATLVNDSREVSVKCFNAFSKDRARELAIIYCDKKGVDYFGLTVKEVLT